MNLEAQIRSKIEVQTKAGIELDSTCQICLRTKFADGIGHICNYCNVRCCAKCGGKVALRSNKVGPVTDNSITHITESKFQNTFFEAIFIRCGHLKKKVILITSCWKLSKTSLEVFKKFVTCLLLLRIRSGENEDVVNS